MRHITDDGLSLASLALNGPFSNCGRTGRRKGRCRRRRHAACCLRRCCPLRWSNPSISAMRFALPLLVVRPSEMGAAEKESCFRLLIVISFV